MKSLLGEHNYKYFSSEYPIFYKNKIQKIDNKDKFFYRSAVDLAIKTNQLSAVAEIIKYIIKFQNNYVSSFIFDKNLIELLDKGVQMEHLLNSKVFQYTFDFE